MSSIVDSQVREKAADVDAALPVLFELERRGQQTAGGAFGAQVDRRGPLSLILQQRRLRVEHIQLRRPAHHEEHNVVLGLGGKFGNFGVAAANCGCGPKLSHRDEHAARARGSRGRPTAKRSSRAAKVCSFALLNIMARKLPRSMPATLARIAPAFLFQDRLTPDPVPSALDRGRSASRYISRMSLMPGASPTRDSRV